MHPALCLITACAAMGASIQAQAETSLAVLLGASSTRNSDLKVDQPATGSTAVFHDVSWKSRDFEAPPYYGLRLTHFSDAKPNWGASFEFIHYKVYAETGRVVGTAGAWNGAPVNESAQLGARVQRFSISHGVNLLALNAIYRFNVKSSPAFPRGRLHPYLGAGVVYYVLHPENTINGLSNDEKYQTSGFGYQALGGARYGLNERWALFAEAKYTHGKARVDARGGGRAETDLSTMHAVVGLSYAF